MSSSAYRRAVERPPSLPTALATTLVGVGLCGLAASNTARNHAARYAGYTWRWTDSVAFGVGVGSAALLILCGLWLARQRPSNPTGRRFVWLGCLLALWFASTFWNSRVGPWGESLLTLSFRPLLFTTVVAWPTGRFDPRWRPRVRWLVAGYVVTSALAVFIGQPPTGPSTGWAWRTWPIPMIGSESLGLVISQLIGLLTPLWSVLVLVAIVHRRRLLPESARRFTQAAVVAGIVAASADLWLVVSNFLARGLEFDSGGLTTIGFVRAIVDYGRFGVVAILFVVDDRLRRRDSLASTDSSRGHSATIEVGAASGARLSSATLAGLLGDPTIRLAWARQGGWVDDEGAIVEIGGPGRDVALIEGPDATTYAVIEYGQGTDLSPSAIAAVTAQLRLGLLRTRREVEAAARLMELRALQRAVLEAQDDARRRLERDLHDGAQQELVGLALQARLDARRDTPEQRVDLAEALELVGRRLLDTVEFGVPVVLRGGLAAALEALAASAPIPVRVSVDGDLDGAFPAAVAAWFVVSEAMANVLKHAGASRASIELRVRGGRIELTVADDGRGGLADVPESIRRRTESAGGSAMVERTETGLTVIRVMLPIDSALGVPAELVDGATS